MANNNFTHLSHIFKRLERRQAESKARAEMRKAQTTQALRDTADADRHNSSYFVATISNANPKDDLPSMEHPLFALRAGDRTVRTYEHNGCTVTVKPGFDGAATIHDKDILIYCISQLVRALDEGQDVSRTVRFTAYDFLKATHRPTDGDSYQRMGAALNRLAGTQINTNIATDGRRERGGFGLIGSWRVVEKSPDNDRMVAVEVTLSDWLYRSVTAKQVKSISRAYFRLRKPLDRRIYELAAKHLGNQAKWQAKVATLHEKAGSRASLREFRRAIKALAESGTLPDYRLAFDAKADAVTFYADRNTNTPFWDTSF